MKFRGLRKNRGEFGFGIRSSECGMETNPPITPGNGWQHLATHNNTSNYFVKKEESVNARPHPNPLPQGEGEAIDRPRFWNAGSSILNRESFGAEPVGNPAHECNRRLTMSPPLLGERVGVRASNLSAPFGFSRKISHPPASGILRRAALRAAAMPGIRDRFARWVAEYPSREFWAAGRCRNPQAGTPTLRQRRSNAVAPFNCSVTVPVAGSEASSPRTTLSILANLPVTIGLEIRRGLCQYAVQHVFNHQHQTMLCPG